MQETQFVGHLEMHEKGWVLKAINFTIKIKVEIYQSSSRGRHENSGKLSG
jgi:hypothetical protein